MRSGGDERVTEIDSARARGEEAPPVRRLHALDGLRGAAALIVLVHHTLLLTPALVEPYRDPRPEGVSGAVWLLTYTPLHLVWDGSVAVVVFFVLSGFVLCLPAANGRAVDWRAYYPQRLLRLYLPVIASVALAVAVVTAVPPGATEDASDWLTGHREPGLRDVVRDAVLVIGPPGATNSALWSLRWEVLFSLLLPAFLLFAGRLRGLAPLKVAVIVLVLAAGAWVGPIVAPYRMGALYHLSVFAVGCLLAFHWPFLTGLGDRINRARRRSLIWWLITGLALLGLESYWLVHATGMSSPWIEAAAAASRVVQVFGAALLIVVAGLWVGMMRPLQSTVVTWLGTRSFSLYLVHEPLVVAAGHLLGPVPAVPMLMVTGTVSLVVAEVFYRVVERPSHVFSRWVGRHSRGRSIAGGADG